MGVDIRSSLYRGLTYWVPGCLSASNLHIYWTQIYMDRLGLARSAIPSPQFYVKHKEWVRRTVHQEQLLEFHYSMGFGPLIEFLNYEGPDLSHQPFPRVNEAGYLRKVKFIALIVGITTWLVFTAVLDALICDGCDITPIHKRIRRWSFMQNRL